MKRSFVALLIIAILATFFPSAAFSASPADVTVHVRNQTGGEVGLSLTLPGGSPMFMTLEEGVTSFTIAEGLYDFYASTRCGNQAGQWNINVTKTLYLTCKSGTLATSLSKNFPGKCDLGLYVLGSGETGYEFYSWELWGSFWEFVIFMNGLTANSPQEAADALNELEGGDSFSAGCYDADSGAYYYPYEEAG